MLRFWMTVRFTVLGSGLLSLFVSTIQAQVQVITEISEEGSSFRFQNILLPAVDDAGAKGKWLIVGGQADRNSGTIECLIDGRVPTNADQPTENFFFAAGTADGLFAVDLGKLTEISEIVSYSWHVDRRAPQLYSVFAATGTEPGFSLPDSVEAVTATSGWKKLADVDTRRKDQQGGQHAARIFREAATLGKFRHLLFAARETDPDHRFSHTFFSEIDVIIAGEKSPTRISAPELRILRFSAADNAFRFTFDVTQALELEDWVTSELKPVILEWYPQIVGMLPSEDFEPHRSVHFRFLRDEEMKGIPAYASGRTISLNAEWFRGQLNGEARGAVVHEMVHIAQRYPGRGSRVGNGGPPPGWIVEGIPDYIRWFLYEPETHGADLSAETLKRARHDASYRTSAHFLNWVIRNHPPEGRLLERLNAIARSGQYSAETWKELTGRSEQELADAWRASRDDQ